MHQRHISRVENWTCRGIASLAFAAILAWGGVAFAAPAPIPDFSVNFPAGVACSFGLSLDGTGGNQVYREFFDRNGNRIRSISAGTGSALTFTNLDTGKRVSLKSNGATTHVTYNADGSSIVVGTGHNILILFPTDIPAGPTTTLYVGRIVFIVDSSDVFTLLEQSGRSTDICAALF